METIEIAIIIYFIIGFILAMIHNRYGGPIPIFGYMLFWPLMLANGI